MQDCGCGLMAWSEGCRLQDVDPTIPNPVAPSRKDRFDQSWPLLFRFVQRVLALWIVSGILLAWV